MSRRKRFLFILLGLLIGAFIGGLLTAESRESYYMMSHDLKDLLKWTAGKMHIKLDPKKPLPLLAFASEEEMENIFRQRFGIKTKRYIQTKDNTIKITIEYYGFYDPNSNTIHVTKEKGHWIEWTVVHELVHYLQYTYQGAKENSKGREEEANRISVLFQSLMNRGKNLN